MILWCLSLLCGIGMFTWRWFYLLGACFATSSLLKTTSTVVMFLTLMLSCVLEGVGRWKHLHIYYYIVLCLVMYGFIFLGGLVWPRSCLAMLLVTFISLVLLVVWPRQGVLSYRLFGSQWCGKFGKKETIEFSTTKSVLFPRWWTK